MRDIKMVDIQSLEVNISNDIEGFINPDIYPKDMYWIFSACDEEWGNNHISCFEDTNLRRGFSGHCVCGCHR